MVLLKPSLCEQFELGVFSEIYACEFAKLHFIYICFSSQVYSRRKDGSLGWSLKTLFLSLVLRIAMNTSSM